MKLFFSRLLFAAFASLLPVANGHHFWLAVTDSEKGEFEITFSEQALKPEATIGRLQDLIEKSLILEAIVWEKKDNTKDGNGDDHDHKHHGYGERKSVPLKDWELKTDRIVGSIPKELLEKRPMISGSVDRGPFKREVDADDILFYFSSGQLGGRRGRGYYHHHDDGRNQDQHHAGSNVDYHFLRGGAHHQYHHEEWHGDERPEARSFHVSAGNCGAEISVGIRGLPQADDEETLIDESIQVCMYEVGAKEKLGCVDLNVEKDEKTGRTMAAGTIDVVELGVDSSATLFATAKMTVTRAPNTDDDYTDNDDDIKVLKIASTSVDYTPACPEHHHGEYYGTPV